MTPARYIRTNNSGTLINTVRHARRAAIKAAGGIRQFKKAEKRNRRLQKELCGAQTFSTRATGAFL